MTIYPSDINQILKITFNEYQNEIIQLQRQILELYQIFKMLRTGFCSALFPSQLF